MLVVPLRWTWLHSSQWLKLTIQSCSHPHPNSDPLEVELKKGLRKGFESARGCSVIYTWAPKTSYYCAGYVLVSFDIGSELQTYPKIAGREPLIERSKLHPMGVETSDPYNNCRDKCLIECFVSLMVVSISIRHFAISTSSFRILLIVRCFLYSNSK